MNKDKKELFKNDALLVSGFLTEFALLKSMSQSKTLTIMVIILTIIFGGFTYFLYKMAGA